MTDKPLDKLDKLDVLVRLVHPDWFEAFRENVRVRENQDEDDWLTQVSRAEYLLEDARVLQGYTEGLTFDLITKFEAEVLGLDFEEPHYFLGLLRAKQNGIVCGNLDHWWRENIVDIAKCSDNPTVRAALKRRAKYADPYQRYEHAQRKTST